MADSRLVSLSRERLVSEAKRFYARGWMPGTAGNLSVRTSSQPLRVLITASGVDKGELEPDDIVEIDGSWHERLWAGRRPSAETWIHAAIYEQVPWAGAVFHVHTVPATLMSLAVGGHADEKVGMDISGLEMIKGLGVWAADAAASIPVFPNWADVSRIADEIRSAITADAVPALLIRGHGITAWGKDVGDARKHIESIDFLCSCLWELHKSGASGPVPYR